MMKAKYRWALAAFCFVIGIIGLLERNAAALGCFVAGIGGIIGVLPLRKWQQWTLYGLMGVGAVLLWRSEMWRTYLFGVPVDLSWNVK